MDFMIKNMQAPINAVILGGVIIMSCILILMWQPQHECHLCGEFIVCRKEIEGTLLFENKSQTLILHLIYAVISVAHLITKNYCQSQFSNPEKGKCSLRKQIKYS